MTDFPLLFEPLDLGPVTLRNRLAMTTHSRDVGARRYERYVEARARGGAAFIGTFASRGLLNSATTPGRFFAEYGAETDALLPLGDDRVVRYLDDVEIPRLAGIARVVQPHGALLFGQLHHAGADRVTPSGTDPGQPTVAPSVHPDEFSRDISHELTLNEIDELVRGFGDAARRCREAGLNGVEINAAHFYLVNQFLSPFINQRTDRYGGSAENRFRFLDEILTEVRSQVGDDLAIGIRLNGSEFVPGGLTAEDMVGVARLLEGRVQYINVTAGTFSGRKGANTVAYVTPWNDVSGLVPLIQEAAIIKAAVSTPVILSGRVTDPAQAEEYLAKGYADVIGMTRAWLADPDFAAKAQLGRSRAIRKCIGTNECHAQGRPLVCTVNAVTGREEEFAIEPGPVGKKVAIIGGGVAGMEAATVAASRGHNVVLFERADELGGTLNLVARHPLNERLKGHLQYMAQQVSEAGVDVRYGTNVDADLLEHGQFDEIIVATGSRPFAPDVPGIGQPHVFDAREVLAGTAQLGRRTVVVAGLDDQLPALMVAGDIADTGREVRVVSAQPLLGQGLEAGVWTSAMRRLAAHNIDVLTLHELMSVGAADITVEHTLSRVSQTIECDSVVLAAGSRAEDSLSNDLFEQGVAHHTIGDCRAPRRMIFAIQEGARIAATL